MKSYHYFHVDKLCFDDDDGSKQISSGQQLGLNVSQCDVEPISSLTLTHADFYKGFAKLKCVHEAIRRESGRAYGMGHHFDSFVAKDSFDGYFNRELNILLVCAGKKKVDGLIRRLRNAKFGNLEIKRFVVDFSRVIEVVSNVRGSWISELPDTNVRSVGLFGDHVDLSDDFSRHRAVGSLSALNVSLQFENEDVNFMITKNCSIVLYRDMSTEEEIDFAMALWRILTTNEALSFEDK